MQSSGYLFVSGEVKAHLGVYNIQRAYRDGWSYDFDYLEFDARESMMLMPLAMDFNAQQNAATDADSPARDQNRFPGYNGMQEYNSLYHEQSRYFRINQFPTAGDSLVEKIYHYHDGESLVFSSGIRR
tara:strand:- start:2935 stop:3318 length:384 start_codon:yes stop_codon:yes gene_type:complete